jgi:Arc/MetJ family transcription regulator
VLGGVLEELFVADFGGPSPAPDLYPLRCMHYSGILMHMRTTLNLDDGLLEEARRITGIKEKTALLHRGLEELIARESARALAALGGTSPKLRPIARRRTASAGARR